MITFEFCQQCIALGNTSDGGFVKICGRCFQGRKEYINQIQRDMAYRSHVARQMAGYPCDISSQCPHHPPTYQFYTHEGDHSFQETRLVKNALAKFERFSYSSITTLELLSGDYLSLVRYCDSCYNRAVDGIEQNLEVPLCNGCLAGRECFITKFHGHQGSFLEPWEWRRSYPHTEGVVLARQIRNGNEVNKYDEYRNETELNQFGGGNPFIVVGLVFAGIAAPALIVSLAGVVYSRRQWRLAQEAQGNGQATIILSRLCADLTSGRVTITRQDVENLSTSSFHTAETHPE